VNLSTNLEILYFKIFYWSKLLFFRFFRLHEKTDAKNRQERWAQGENTMRIKNKYRVEGRLNQPKQKGASSGIQTKDGVHTRVTLRHVIEKRPTPECRFHNRTHTM
jgi:hypothetical protein